MASIQCSKCKMGIHYHGEPDGIEYVFITIRDWTRITASRFNRENKEYFEGSSIPKLFQTDTIEEDFPAAVHKIWKCPHCGSLMIFDGHGKVTEAFENVFTMPDKGRTVTAEYVIFDDYSWNQLTELALPDWKIGTQVSPTLLAGRTDSQIYIYDEDSNLLRVYRKIENQSEGISKK